jgi:hypothetical protein
MKSFVSAVAILAFTAGTAAAGCGYHSKGEVADKDTGKTTSETVASTTEQAPKGTSAGDTGRTGEQLAESPESKGETTK